MLNPEPNGHPLNSAAAQTATTQHTPRASLPGPVAAAAHTPTLTVDVIGTPVAQGSKVANRFGHGVRDSNDSKLRPWRAEVAGVVADTMRQTGWIILDGPIEVTIVFRHARLASHYGTGRNAGILKPSAPVWKSTAPDIDKLTRAILDALTTSRAIRDDARVARLVVEDVYADDHATGARITISALSGTTDAASAPQAPSPMPGAGAAPHPTPTTREQALW